MENHKMHLAEIACKNYFEENLSLVSFFATRPMKYYE